MGQQIRINVALGYSPYTAHHDRRGSTVRIRDSELELYICTIDQEECCVIDFLLKCFPMYENID